MKILLHATSDEKAVTIDSLTFGSVDDMEVFILKENMSNFALQGIDPVLLFQLLEESSITVAGMMRNEYSDTKVVSRIR